MADHRENVVSMFLPLCSNSCSSSVISHHQLFGVKKPGALQGLIGHINSGLNSSKKRVESLRLLAYLIEQCSAAVFTSHCQTWLTLLLQCLQTHAAPLIHQYTLHVLSLVIERVTDYPELAREVGSSYIAQLLPVLLSPKSKKCEDATAACINKCIMHFPGPAGQFKGKIEALLTDLLDCPFPSPMVLRCYALLARCGTSGNQGIKHREAWSLQCSKLLSTLHGILSQLYDGLETGQETGEDLIFSSKSLPSSQPEMAASLVSRFQVLCSCLDSLMREPFPTWIPMPAEDILDFVCRALAIQVTILMNKMSTDHVLLLSYLPIVHCAVLKVLHRLIICCKKLLLPQGSVILRLCAQCLAATRTQSAEPGQERPFSKLRQAVYSVLTVWLEIVGSACQGLLDDEQEDLLKEIFHDIQVQSETLKIESKSAAGGDFNPPATKRKKKGRGYQELSHVSSTLSDRCRQTNTSLTVSALKVLQLLVTYAGSTLNSQAFQMVQQRVGNLVLSVLRNHPPPFTSAPCRQALYQTLLATVCIPRPDAPSFLQGALALFQEGMLDSDYQVAHTCQEAILRCSSLIHTTTPNVHIPAFTSSVDMTSTEQFSITTLSSRVSISSSAAAEIPIQESIHTVSTSSDSVKPSHAQHSEKPTSTSSAGSSAFVRSAISRVEVQSSSRDGRTSVSSSLPKDFEENPRKRKKSEEEEIMKGKGVSKSICVNSEESSGEENEHSDDMDDDDTDESVIASASWSAARKGVVRDALSKEGMSADSVAETKAACPSAKGKGVSKKLRTSSDQDDGAISSSTSSSEQSKQAQTQSDDVQAMLMTFVDVGPDSD